MATNVGIAELGEDNLYHLGSDGLEPITMVMVEFRRGRPAEKRLALGRAIVDICVELLGVPRYAFGLPGLERRVWKQKGARSRLCENERLRAIRASFVELRRVLPEDWARQSD